MKSDLILLHGALGSSEQLRPLGELLHSSYNIHYLDFDGHGKNPTEKDYSIELFAENLSDYIKSNKLQKVKVFGYSMGGYVALYLTSKEPGLIESIFTLGTKFNWTPETAAKEVRMLDPEVIEEKVPKFASQLAILHGEENWKAVLENTAKMMLSLGNGSGLKDSDLRSAHIPVLITVGGKDQMVSIEESQRTASLIPNSRFKIFEDFIHPIDRIDPDILSQSISDFLGN